MSVYLGSVALEKKHLRADKRESVQENCKSAVKRGLPVTDFVRTVWAYTPDMIPDRVDKQPYKLSHELVNAYLQEDERKSYTAFASIVMDLLAQLYPADPVAGDCTPGPARIIKATVTSTRKTRDEKLMKQRGTKPDLTWSTSMKALHCWRLIWESCLAFVEINRPSVLLLFLSRDIPIESSMFSQNCRSAVAVANETDSDEEDSEEEDSEEEDSIEKDSEEECSDPDDDLSKGHLKRQRSRSTTQETNGPPVKRFCRQDSVNSLPLAKQPVYDNGPLGEHEFNAALCIMEMLERSLRSSASGFTVNGTVVTLWYGDRMGLVASAQFDFLEEAHLLLLAVAALGAADEELFGICPYLTSPACGDFDRAALVLPPLKARDAYGGPIYRQVVLKMYHPGRLIPGKRYRVVGAGTMIFSVRAVKAESALDDEELITKVSWPPEECQAETTALVKVITALREKAPQYCKHVTEIKYYIEESFAEHGLPRATMLGLATDKPRRFVLMVMKKYEPMHRVASVREFKVVFTDAVRAHWWVAETSGVLHGDISLNNIMFYRRDGKVIGVLMDWDHAMQRDLIEEAKYDLEMPSSDDPLMKWVYQFRPARYWYTRPYIDLERQSAAWDEMPPHRYAHDLEAFFWVLLHFLQQFEPWQGVLLSTNYFDMRDDADIALWKRAFLETPDGYEDAAVRVHEEYVSVWDEWVPGLRDIFRRAYSIGTTCNLSERLIRENLIIFAEESDGEEVEWIVRRLRDKIRVRKEAVTYEAFMAVLGEPLDIAG